MQAQASVITISPHCHRLFKTSQVIERDFFTPILAQNKNKSPYSSIMATGQFLPHFAGLFWYISTNNLITGPKLVWCMLVRVQVYLQRSNSLLTLFSVNVKIQNSPLWLIQCLIHHSFQNANWVHILIKPLRKVPPSVILIRIQRDWRH